MAGSIFEGFDLDGSLNIFRQNTNTQMGKVKEGVLTPIDVTGDKLKEGVALVKPEDTSVRGTITKYKSSAVSELDGIIGMLSGGLLNTKAITKAIKIGPNGVTLNDDSILSSVSSKMGTQVSGKSSAMRKLSSMLTGEFKALTGINLNGIITTDGKKFRIRDNWRTSVGQETLKLINQYTGINEFIDTSVQYALYNSMMKMAAEYGMKDSYKSIYALYKSKRTADQIMVDSVRTMITSGDIESIDAVVAILDQNGVNAINAAYPEFIKTIFRSFKFDDDIFAEDYTPLRNKLLYVLGRVCGPQWWMTYTEFGMAYDLSLVNAASRDILTLLGDVDYLIPLLCTAGQFQERSAVTEMKRKFKDAPVYQV